MGSSGAGSSRLLCRSHGSDTGAFFYSDLWPSPVYYRFAWSSFTYENKCKKEKTTATSFLLLLTMFLGCYIYVFDIEAQGGPAPSNCRTACLIHLAQLVAWLPPCKSPSLLHLGKRP
jgi:hypothetical protein